MAPERYHDRITKLLSLERHLSAPLDKADGPSVCLAFPNSYRVGMASLGFQAVRRLLADAGCRVERTFLPEPEEEGDVRAGGLLAWESRRHVQRFDVLAFSVQFENDFLNLLRMLLQAGLPPRAADRHQGHPLVLAGGAAVTINPLPLAPFVDVFVFGESEKTIPQVAQTIEALKGERTALLEALAELPGVYVPSVEGEPAKERLRPPDLDSARIAMSDIVTPEAEFGETVLIEIGRGCSMGCRYCWIGWTCRPLRHHRVDGLLAAVDRLPPELDRIGIIATSHYDHPGFLEFIDGLRTRGRRITTSSLRVDEVEPRLLEYIVESGTRGVTLAPETGSDVLRRSVGKRFDNERVLRAAAMVAESGLEQLKLYFIVGLPGESDADVEAVGGLVGRIAETTAGRLKLVLSVNIFVPKPNTPFGDEALLPERELRRRLRLLRKSLAGIGDLEVSTMAPWEAVLQTLLTRGGPEVGELLLEGARMNWPDKTVVQKAPASMLDQYVFLTP